ncbi:MAG: biotin/lipoyl-binding protein, partial [Chloroflexi bacterium]|nr:biotin/lipoyl-binding protein [Chloroflexota bacterium]
MLDALRTLKLWQILVLAVVTLGTAAGVYGIYSWATSPDTSSLPANTQLVPVEYGDLVNTVSASGSLVFPTRAQPTFGSAGTVEQLNAKDGETVKKGQVLAKLDSASLISLQKTVAQARVNLRNAEDNLEKARNPYTELDIAQAEAAVTAARVAIKTAQDNLEKAQNPYTDSDIVQAEAAVTAAKVAIKTAQDNLEKAQNPYIESDIAQAEAAVTSAKVAIKTAQDNLEKAQNPYTDSDIVQAEAAVTAAKVAIKTAQ